MDSKDNQFAVTANGRYRRLVNFTLLFGLLLVFAGCTKDPVKVAQVTYLEKGDLDGGVKFLEKASIDEKNYSNEARQHAKAKLDELYPAYYLKNSPTYLVNADNLFDKKEFQQASDLYKLIPPSAPEYNKAQDKLNKATDLLKFQNLKEHLVGDWEGQLFSIYLAGRQWNPLYGVKIRVSDDKHLLMTTSLGESFQQEPEKRSYLLSPMVHIEKIVKDDFGQISEKVQIEAFPFKVSFGSTHIRYLVVDSENQISLYTHESLVKDIFQDGIDVDDLQQKIVLTRS